MIDFEEHSLFSVVFRWRGSVVPKAFCFAFPGAVLAPLLLFLSDLTPDVHEFMAIEFMASSVIWSSTTACLIFLVGFRTQQALGRFWEGTGLLHQMRGEWFDAASNLTTFSRKAKTAKVEEVNEFRGTLVRLMSLLHGSALEEIKAESTDAYQVIDIRGLDPQTRSYLGSCKKNHGFNRVEILLHMIQVLITQNLDEGVLQVAPPILSRVYQTLSRGYVNLLDARKITDTKFPFPLAQLLSFLLIFHALFAPVAIATVVRHKAWAAILTFLPVFALSSLNFVAIEIENPFGDDDNDLPLEDFQNDMNSSLLMLISDEADHLAHMSRDATLDVRKTMRKSTQSAGRHGTISWQLGAGTDPEGEDGVDKASSLQKLGQTLSSIAHGSMQQTASIRSIFDDVFDDEEFASESITEAKSHSAARTCIQQVAVSQAALPTESEQDSIEVQEIRPVARVPPPQHQESNCNYEVCVVPIPAHVATSLSPRISRISEASVDDGQGPPNDGCTLDRRVHGQRATALELTSSAEPLPVALESHMSNGDLASGLQPNKEALNRIVPRGGLEDSPAIAAFCPSARIPDWSHSPSL